MKTNRVIKGIGLGILCIGAFFALGYVIMALWNWLIPSIFGGARAISFCEAIGLFILTKLLFGGFKGKMGGGCCCSGGRRGWKARWENKWSQMTPEEREKIKKGFGGKCGWHDEETKEEPLA